MDCYELIGVKISESCSCSANPFGVEVWVTVSTYPPLTIDAPPPRVWVTFPAPSPRVWETFPAPHPPYSQLIKFFLVRKKAQYPVLNRLNIVQQT